MFFPLHPDYEAPEDDPLFLWTPHWLALVWEIRGCVVLLTTETAGPWVGPGR